MDGERESRDEPMAVPVDTAAEQRELEEAGWVRVEREGKTLWQRPESGHLYPQGAAITLVRRGAHSGEVPDEQKGGS